MQTIQYTAKGKIVHTERRELSKLSKGKIKSNEKEDWVDERLVVPPLPPTNLRGCHLIRIQYDLFVSNRNKQGNCLLNCAHDSFDMDCLFLTVCCHPKQF